MKKLLVLMSLLGLISSSAFAVENQPTTKENVLKTPEQIKMHRENLFEKRLGLTEVQKLKARHIRLNGHKQLEPIIMQIIMKKQEAEMVRRSRMAIQMQEEKLSAIDKELAILDKKAKEIRKNNMKEFESILTRDQKRILKKMKKEGRKQYHQNHPQRPPFTKPQIQQPQNQSAQQ